MDCSMINEMDKSKFSNTGASVTGASVSANATGTSVTGASVTGASVNATGTSATGTSAANPTEHKLYDKWTLWAHLPHDTNWTFESYIRILTFNTAEEIIMLLETI